MSDFQITPASLAAMVRVDIANALVAATPGGIEAQEARCRRDMARVFATPALAARRRGLALIQRLGCGGGISETFKQVPRP